MTQYHSVIQEALAHYCYFIWWKVSIIWLTLL